MCLFCCLRTALVRAGRRILSAPSQSHPCLWHRSCFYVERTEHRAVGRPQAFDVPIRATPHSEERGYTNYHYRMWLRTVLRKRALVALVCQSGTHRRNWVSLSHQSCKPDENALHHRHAACSRAPLAAEFHCPFVRKRHVADDVRRLISIRTPKTFDLFESRYLDCYPAQPRT